MNNSEKILIAELNNNELENISGGGLWADIKSFFGGGGFGGGDFGGGGAGGSY